MSFLPHQDNFVAMYNTIYQSVDQDCFGSINEFQDNISQRKFDENLENNDSLVQRGPISNKRKSRPSDMFRRVPAHGLSDGALNLLDKIVHKHQKSKK